MKSRSLIFNISLFAAFLTSCAAPPVATPTATVIETATETNLPTPSPISFAAEVQPILDASCIKCHGVESTKDGLDLQTYQNMMNGSRDGAVILPGDAAKSELVDLIKRGKMPKRGKKLSDEEIRIIIDWVNQGALNN